MNPYFNASILQPRCTQGIIKLTCYNQQKIYDEISNFEEQTFIVLIADDYYFFSSEEADDYNIIRHVKEIPHQPHPHQ